MATKRAFKGEGRIGDEAVRKATGKTWEEWFRILDKAGAQEMAHKDIATLLDGKFPKIGGWWCQMVTVGYEQTRGLRQKHEKPTGFEISVSKTVPAPLSRLYRAWSDSKTRARWLPGEKVTIRTATANKSARVTWSDGKTSLSLNFYAAGAGRSKIVAQHGKLASAAVAQKMKVYWADRLEALKALLAR